jgi:hypothetical protein
VSEINFRRLIFDIRLCFLRLAWAKMSLFFFRLHNLRREEEKKNRRRKIRGGGCGGGGGGGSETPSIAGGRYDNVGSSSLSINPGKLFEKPLLAPEDSLDEEALKIPRLINTKMAELILLFCLKMIYLKYFNGLFYDLSEKELWLFDLFKIFHLHQEYQTMF